MNQKIVTLICGSALLFGCSSWNTFSKKEPPAEVHIQKIPATKQEIKKVEASQPPLAQQTEESPKLIEAEYGYWVYEHEGRMYVIGQMMTNHKFRKSGNLPYTRTILGAGPKGETVVFEVNKKDPHLVERLQAKFYGKPMLLESDQDYWVYKREGRHYVVGKASTNAEFQKSGHLPYTRTILGAAPGGETVVFEVDKKNPQLVERLQSKYLDQPMLLDSDQNYWVYEHEGRHYVVGQAKTREQFQTSGHLPYTRTVLGAGPTGETVVFEVNKKDPQLVERLEATYLKQPLLLKHEKDYWVYEHEGRHYVMGQSKTKEQFQKSGHLPYTRTILGAGPAGETVVFEVNKKDPKLVDRLVKQYQIQ